VERSFAFAGPTILAATVLPISAAQTPSGGPQKLNFEVNSGSQTQGFTPDTSVDITSVSESESRSEIQPRQCLLSFPSTKEWAPNTKAQTPSSREIPNFKFQNLSQPRCLGAWDLEFIWCLMFGVWCFVFSPLT